MTSTIEIQVTSTATQVEVTGRDGEDGADGAPGQDGFLVLDEGDPVPGGTAAGTLIFRRVP